VVLPTYQEAANVATVLEGLHATSPDTEVLVVDDASPDGTASIAQHTADRLGGITVLRRSGKSGLGEAYRAGFAWGLQRGFEAMVEMDADLSHDPADVTRLLRGLDDAELVIGSRYVPGGSIPAWGWHRRLLSVAGNRYSAAALGLGVRDLTSGFRAYRAEVLRALDLSRVRADGYAFQIEMAYRVSQQGGRIREIPIRFVDRTAGESKMSMRIAGEALLLVTGWGLRRVAGSATGAAQGVGQPEGR
jgi:dolichol-phosphate mannosyltransferase